MLNRDRAGRFLRARWPPLLALAATLAYAVVVIGFGLDFRPLHNDEGVTLGVASRASALDVLRVAVDHRHGPPLHYHPLVEPLSTGPLAELLTRQFRRAIPRNTRARIHRPETDRYEIEPAKPQHKSHSRRSFRL